MDAVKVHRPRDWASRGDYLGVKHRNTFCTFCRCHREADLADIAKGVLDGFLEEFQGPSGSAFPPVHRPAPADGPAGGTFAPERVLEIARRKPRQSVPGCQDQCNHRPS